MFAKHTFTCPDVIHLRNKQKKYNQIAIGAQVLFFGGLYAAGKVMDRRVKTELTVVPETPTETQE